MSSKGKLIVFTAPSGAGKTSIVKHLLQQELNLSFSVSATTRSQRDGEIDGKDYYFFSPDSFRTQIQEGAFVEWEEVYTDQFYGTLKSEVDKKIAAGQHVIFDIDVKGAESLKAAYPDNSLVIFVSPPSLDALADRLRGRKTEDDASFKKRIDRATYELSFADSFDVNLINDDLATAQQDAEQLIKNFIQS